MRFIDDMQVFDKKNKYVISSVLTYKTTSYSKIDVRLFLDIHFKNS